jgi:hypothetical protein
MIGSVMKGNEKERRFMKPVMFDDKQPNKQTNN